MAPSLRGPASPWAPYLATLPAHVPIALFWGEPAAAPSPEALRDGRTAAAWLRGTEVQREVERTPVVSICLLSSLFVVFPVRGSRYGRDLWAPFRGSLIPLILLFCILFPITSADLIPFVGAASILRV